MKSAAPARKSLDTAPSETGPRNGIYCAGCGLDIDPQGEKCASCQTPVYDAKFDEVVVIKAGMRIAYPTVCACCLREKETTRIYKVTTGMNAHVETFVYAHIPFCKACYFRRYLFQAAAAGLALGGGFGFAKLADLLNASDGVIFFALAVPATVIWLYSTFKLLPSLKFFRRPGHTSGCTTMWNTDAGEIHFGSRAFAHLWRSLNR